MTTPWAYGDKGAFMEYMTTHLPEQPGNQVQDIAPVELRQMLLKAYDQGPVVLDVREPWEYRSGHVPGAILIPLGELAQRVGELDPSRPVAVICAHGHRSLAGASLLAQRGLAKVYNVLGGTTGWKEAGLETTRN
jgi:rhodanese-related sulfurtransferase